MSDDIIQDELITLKSRADTLGISYHPNIGIDKLRKKVTAKLTPTVQSTPGNTKVNNTIETPAERTKRLRDKAAKLIRIRISCMNPNKKEHPGEVVTVSNSVVGTFKKFVSFDNDEGWHVPNIIYQHLKERQCQIFVTTTDARGNKSKTGKLIREFAIEVLPDLTAQERKDLAEVQAATRSID